WSRWTESGALLTRATAAAASAIGASEPWNFTQFSEIWSTAPRPAASAPAAMASAVSRWSTLRAARPQPSAIAASRSSRVVTRGMSVLQGGGGGDGRDRDVGEQRRRVGDRARERVQHGGSGPGGRETHRVLGGGVG